MHPWSDVGGYGRIHHLSPESQNLRKRPVTLSVLINTSDSFLTIFKNFTFSDRICLSDSWVQQGWKSSDKIASG